MAISNMKVYNYKLSHTQLKIVKDICNAYDHNTIMGIVIAEIIAKSVHNDTLELAVTGVFNASLTWAICIKDRNHIIEEIRSYKLTQ